ncbi:meiosis-specific protein MEI4 isoform X1 [Tachysurus ichikawai]
MARWRLNARQEFAVLDNLTECLICLGGASVLRPVLVHRVLTRIVRLAEQLWGACQMCATFMLKIYLYTLNNRLTDGVYKL